MRVIPALSKIPSFHLVSAAHYYTDKRIIPVSFIRLLKGISERQFFGFIKRLLFTPPSICGFYNTNKGYM